MTQTERFPVRNRWTDAVQFTAEIDCDPEVPHSAKLGLAVKWALASGAKLSDADIRGAKLEGADLSGAKLSDADIRGAKLEGADLSGAKLSDADIRGADLSGAKLSDADIRGADLRGADLVGADLSGAKLRGADLRGADLVGAKLVGADIMGEKVLRTFAALDRSDGYTFRAFELEARGVKIQAGCRWLTPEEYRAHVAAEYPNTDKAAETLLMIDFIEARARQVGALKETEQ